MQDKLGKALPLKQNANVLDAGCGMGNVPMLKKFYTCTYVPYFFIKQLRLQKHVINTVSAVEFYNEIVTKDVWRYNIITVMKSK